MLIFFIFSYLKHFSSCFTYIFIPIWQQGRARACTVALPLGSRSPACPLVAMCCVCGVLGHVAPGHRCARSVRCALCAASWATWLLFTGVHTRLVVLRVRCPGPLGSCSPLCTLGLLCCVCGVLCHLAPVHPCACSVCGVACAMSRATWLLFTCVLAGRVVLRARCPRPLGSRSAVCSLGVLRCVLRLRCPGPLGSCSPVRALGLLCCVCGVSLQDAESSIRTAACRSRQALGTLRARTRPSGRRLFRSRQGLGTLPGSHSSIRRAAVLWPAGAGFAAGRAHVHPDGGWCCLAPVLVPLFVACCARCPGLRHWVPVVAWHLSVCLRCGGRVPLWRALWPCMVRRASSGPNALGAPVGFPVAVVPFPSPGAVAPGFTGRLHGAGGGRPRTGLIVPAASPG